MFPLFRANNRHYSVLSLRVKVLSITDLIIYVGVTMLHCHFLIHEDGGAIAYINVTGTNLPAFPSTLNHFFRLVATKARVFQSQASKIFIFNKIGRTYLYASDS